MLKNIRIKSLQDNYIWILSNQHKKCIIIDPGDAKKVINVIKKKNLVPKIILITHYHQDHIQGVLKLSKKYAIKKIYGPLHINEKNKFSVNSVFHLQKLHLLKNKCVVLKTPGHTNHDISYFISPFLFCGDVLFSGGCGKVLTGNYRDMFNSITLINLLPNNTKICSGHEYTLENLLFSQKILKKDKYINCYLNKVKKIHNKEIKITTLKTEKKINIFLRTKEKKIQKILFIKNNKKSSYKCFLILRHKKNNN